MVHFFNLPYDIRYHIYQHVFPRGEQVYIAIFRETMRAIIPDDKVPISFLLTCREIHNEASEYLYNNYLFNLIGTKRDCLSNYETFLAPLRKYARNEVYIDAFSNGPHSATMCLSIHVGNARSALLNRRQRGQPKEIQELKREVALIRSKQPTTTWMSSIIWTLVGLLAAMAFASLASLSIWLGVV